MTQKSPNIIKKPVSGRDCPCCTTWDNISLEKQVEKEWKEQVEKYQEDWDDAIWRWLNDI